MKRIITSLIFILLSSATFAQPCNFNMLGTLQYSQVGCSTTPNSITVNNIGNNNVLIFDVNTTVSGNVILGFNGDNSEIIINAGVTLRIQGDLNFNGSNGPKKITVNGHLIVQGNFNAQSNVTYGGSGLITTAQNWQNNSSSSVCTSPCNLMFEINNCLQPDSPICQAAALNASSLPITLLSFTAEQQGERIRLTWQTAQEIDNDFFTIEVSENGIDFEALAQIDAIGNSISLETYTHTVAYQATGVRYFRLKQTDFDGTFTYSHSIALRLTAQGDLVKVFRDARQPQNIHLKGVIQEATSIRVLDTYGRVIYQTEITSLDGEQVISLPQFTENMLIVQLNSVSIRKVTKL